MNARIRSAVQDASGAPGKLPDATIDAIADAVIRAAVDGLPTPSLHPDYAGCVVIGGTLVNRAALVSALTGAGMGGNA